MHFAGAHAPYKNMTTGDWLGLVCLAGLVGFFAGGFFVWNLFFKPKEPDDDEEPIEDDLNDDEPDLPAVDQPDDKQGG